MKPGQQPDAFESGEVLERLLIAAVREQFDFVEFLRGGRRLVPGLELHLLPGAKMTDR